MNNKLVSVVIPAYNEELVVEKCYQDLTSVLEQTRYRFELVFVNDGSWDRTGELLAALSQKDSRVKVLSFSRNFGHQMALTAGLDHANGDAVVVIDADLQDPPAVIVEMLDKWQQGYHIVYGQRMRRRGETVFKKITASLYYRMLLWLTDVRIPVDTGDFRLMDRKVVLELRKIRERHRFVRGLVSWVGFQSAKVEYVREERYQGVTKYPVFKMLRLALDGITSFSNKPLKLALLIGALGVVAGFFMLIYALFSYFYFDNVVSGWTSLLLSVIFFGSVQLLTIGIIGEYIGRIHEETKNRPLYIIEDKINF